MTVFVPRRRSRLVNQWTTDDIGRLRRLAEEGLPVASIALALRRSEFSIRNKAGIHGISLKRSLPGHVLPGSERTTFANRGESEAVSRVLTEATLRD